MSKNRLPNDLEIDLFETFSTLWDGKRKIIATIFIVALLGTSLFFALPNLYKITGPIKQSEESVFFPFISLNELLETSKIDLRIDKEKIFTMFVAEFNDYEEILEILSKNEYVKQSLEGLDEIDKQAVLIEFAKLFKLKPPTKQRTNWLLSLEWHDELDGMRIIDEAFQKVLVNTKLKLIEGLDELAFRLDQRKDTQIEALERKLDIIRKNGIVEARQKKLFLKEQAAIAKELNIEKNNLNATNLAVYGGENDTVSFNPSQVPFYLRGYKAIDKEISQIETRSSEEELLSARDYVNTMREYIYVENDIAPSQFRKASLMLANLSSDNWINFDLRFVDIKSEKNPVLYAIFSLALGGMIGIFYTLISNVNRKRKGKMNKA